MGTMDPLAILLTFVVPIPKHCVGNNVQEWVLGGPTVWETVGSWCLVYGEHQFQRHCMGNSGIWAPGVWGTPGSKHCMGTMPSYVMLVYGEHQPSSTVW
jgi:hypothetical protein